MRIWDAIGYMCVMQYVMEIRQEMNHRAWWKRCEDDLLAACNSHLKFTPES